MAKKTKPEHDLLAIAQNMAKEMGLDPGPEEKGPPKKWETYISKAAKFVDLTQDKFNEQTIAYLVEKGFMSQEDPGREPEPEPPPPPKKEKKNPPKKGKKKDPPKTKDKPEPEPEPEPEEEP